MRTAIIPARGGSKRIPQKNIRDFFGKPIMVYAIETAQQSNLFDRIIVSTDCMAIADVAEQYGVEVFERQADDGTRGTQDVAAEIINGWYVEERDTTCVIYPTSPLLLPTDLIQAAIYLTGNKDALYVMSVQQEPLADAGCFYFGRTWAFQMGKPLIDTRTIMYPLPAERCCDINVESDWARAEQLYQRMQEKQ